MKSITNGREKKKEGKCMDLNKENMTKIRYLITFAIILYLGVQNIHVVLGVLGLGWGLLFPFIVGSAMAFVLNVPMTFIERHLFGKAKENYKKRMQDLFSIHNQAYFQKRLNLHVVKNENEQVFYQELEVITKAIKEKKKIRFEYQKPSLTFNEKHKLTELAPIDTVFSNNEYYLLCQGAKDPNTCIQYRLDYIKNVEIVKDSDVKFDDYQLNSFEKKLNNMTYMYGEGKIEVIELEFTPNVYSNMIDKFGKDIHPKKINENLYCVQVRLSMPFLLKCR